MGTHFTPMVHLAMFPWWTLVGEQHPAGLAAPDRLGRGSGDFGGAMDASIFPKWWGKGLRMEFPTTWLFVFGEVLFFHVLLLFPNLSCDFTGQLWVFSCHLAQWFYLLRWWLLRDCTNQRGANQQRVVLLPKRSDFPWFSKLQQEGVIGCFHQAMIGDPAAHEDTKPLPGGRGFRWLMHTWRFVIIYIKIIITIIVILIIMTIYRCVWSFIIIYHHIIIYYIYSWHILYNHVWSFIIIRHHLHVSRDLTATFNWQHLPTCNIPRRFFLTRPMRPLSRLTSNSTSTAMKLLQIHLDISVSVWGWSPISKKKQWTMDPSLFCWETTITNHEHSILEAKKNLPTVEAPQLRWRGA